MPYVLTTKKKHAKPKAERLTDMENQHRKITGYRELSAEEIDLMNQIKENGEELGRLINKMEARNAAESSQIQDEHVRINDPELFIDNMNAAASCQQAIRWTGIGKDSIQLGLMALVRAVARPTTF